MSYYKLSKKFLITFTKNKISKLIIQQVTNYIVKEYDKLFILFSLYTIQFKIKVFPFMVVILL